MLARGCRRRLWTGYHECVGSSGAHRVTTSALVAVALIGFPLLYPFTISNGYYSVISPCVQPSLNATRLGHFPLPRLPHQPESRVKVMLLALPVPRRLRRLRQLVHGSLH